VRSVLRLHFGTGDGDWQGTDSRDLRVALGINGYILHPAVAPLRLDLDLRLAQLDNDNGGGRDESRVGLGGRIRLFPRGRYSAGFQLGRRYFDYSRGRDDPLATPADPDTVTQWRGWARARSGPLRGTTVSFERRDNDLLDPDLGGDRYDGQLVSWSRANRWLHNEISLERREREYGHISLATEDHSLRVTERARIAPDWSWTLIGFGIRREVTRTLAASSSTAENLNLRNRFVGRVRDRDRIDLTLRLDRSEPESGSITDGQTLTAFYRWMPTKAWDIGPFMGYDRRSADGMELEAPRAGVAVNWNHSGRHMDTLLSADGDFGQLRRRDDAGTLREKQTAYRLAAWLGQGKPVGLRRELLLEAVYDALRQRGPMLDLPDLGLGGELLDTEDRYRAELTLTHVNGTGQFESRTDWERFEVANGGEGGQTERYRSFLQFGSRHVNLQGEAGGSHVDASNAADQRLRFVGATAHWRPTAYLSLRATVRDDDREVNLAPDVDTRRYEAGLTFTFGQLRVEGYVDQFEQSIDGATPTKTRSFRWSVSSRFAGWMPWETGTKRRGVIR
jgi:hypothetical protein